MTPGEIVAERFVLEEEAGAGAVGSVFRATDRSTGQRVALKVMRNTRRSESQRFEREARVLEELRHPGIVRYVAHGLGTAGQAWIAMEWLDGSTLARRLARGRLSIEETITLLARVADALAAAHRLGVVHRDIKPGNVFLVDDSVARPKLLDFGVARRGNLSAVVTSPGALVGTPAYMSPEQARGARRIDARADVFALGSVAFRCLTGRRAFAATELTAILLKIVLEEAAAVSELVPEVPPSLDRLVAQMLAKNPLDRPRDGEAVLAALSSIGHESVSVVRGVSRSGPPRLGRGEQELVSVVVASPRALVQDEAPGPPRPMSSRRLATLRAAVRPFAARLEWLMDGSLVVAFRGAGNATDQAARAARCALVLRAHFPRSLLAIATGRRVSDERMPVGEVIDRAAAQLRAAADLAPIVRDGDAQQVAPIALDEVTTGLLDQRFDVRGGRDRAPGALSLHGEREMVEAARTLLGRHVPCVGRDRELDMLRGLLDESAEEPRARAVLVTGPPGVGKSRLRWELLQRVASERRPVQVWLGRGDSMRAGSSFSMLAPPLRHSAGILEGEPSASQRLKLHARVARYVDPAEVDRVTEFLERLVGLADDGVESVRMRAARNDPMLMADQIRRAFEDFLAAECAAQPQLLVLEDLHWGDLSSVKLVDSALRRLRDAPLMVLALARPEVTEAFPRLFADRELQEIRLGALSRRAAERIVREALGEAVDSDTIARVVERAGGNAFFLEELVRAVSAGNTQALPPTLLAVVQARLSTLEAPVRRVLRAGSVFGQTFWRGAVEALVGEGGAEIASALSELVDREIVASRGEGAFPGEPEYIFRHAFLREAAYDLLKADDRALGHRLAARWLEAHGSQESILLADHHERGGERAEAARFYLRAAREAVAGHDLEGAVARAARGVECGATGELLGDLLMLQADAHRWRGTIQEAGQRAQAALPHLRQGGPRHCAALGHMAAMYGEQGDAARLREIADVLSGLDVAEDARGALAMALGRAAVYLYQAGRADLATAAVARMRVVGEPLARAQPEVEALMYWTRAALTSYEGDHPRFLELTERAVEAFDAAADLRGACSQRANLGNAYKELGDWERAAPVLRAALADSERLGLHNNVAIALQNLGYVTAQLGHLDEAEPMERRSAQMFASLGNRRMEGVSRIYLASILLTVGDHPQALEEARAGVELTSAFPAFYGFALAVLARVELARGRPAEAFRVSTVAMEEVDARNRLEEGETVVRLTHAEATLSIGDAVGARTLIEKARQALLSRAARFDDQLRRTFLERVPENARVLALARDLARPEDGT